ncbi:MAG: GerMN domain-containing protein [Bacillota bacterium]
MNKTIRVFAAILCCLLLAGCAERTDPPEQLVLVDQQPPKVPPEDQPEETFMAQLYFVSESRALAVEEREVDRFSGQSRAEAVIDAMLEGPQSPSLEASLPEGLHVEDVELTSKVANVLLSGQMPPLQDWIIARTAVAAAVCAAETGIQSVNVYLEEQEPGFMGRPLGAQTPIDGALDLYVERVFERYSVDQGQQTEAGTFETADATLYFLDATEQYLIGNNRQLHYSKAAPLSEIVHALIDELTLGVTGQESLRPVLPADLTLAEEPLIEPIIVGDGFTVLREDGTVANECLVHLVFNRPAGVYSEQNICAAMVLSIIGFIPEVRGVLISFVEEDGTVTQLNQGQFYSRERFAGMIGHTVELAFPASDGSALYAVHSAVAQGAVYDPLERVKAMFTSAADPGVAYRVFTEDDVLDVYIVGGIAVIDWAEGFSDKLRELIEGGWADIPGDRRERMFLFGVIDTAAKLPGVTRVWMLENGRLIESPGMVFLRKPLMYNPGLLLQVETS